MTDSTPRYPTIEDTIGNTPLVRLMRLPGAGNAERGNVLLGKLEGNNPAGSVKDRPALSMIKRAEERGDIRPGDTLIEATSGNTGIALAMAAAVPTMPTSPIPLAPAGPRSGSSSSIHTASMPSTSACAAMWYPARSWLG